MLSLSTINSTKLFRWQLTPISLIIEAREVQGNSKSSKGVDGVRGWNTGDVLIIFINKHYPMTAGAVVLHVTCMYFNWAALCIV
jgi:hypothetical protein